MSNTDVETCQENPLALESIVYRFLALAFHKPGDELIDLIKDADYRRAIRIAVEKTLPQGITTDFESIYHDLFPGAGAQPPTKIDLEIEYNRLFVGPSAPPCPPYESVYDESRPFEQYGTILGPSTEWMESALEEEGLSIDVGYKEYADHIAIELEYMVYLLGQALLPERLSMEVAREKAQKLKTLRLSNWAVKFGECVAQSARLSFYRGAGNLLASFIQAG